MEWQKILRIKNYMTDKHTKREKKKQSCDERTLSRNTQSERSKNAVGTQSVRTGSAGEERGDAGRDAGHALHQRELLTYNPQRAARPEPPPPHNPPNPAQPPRATQRPRYAF